MKMIAAKGKKKQDGVAAEKITADEGTRKDLKGKKGSSTTREKQKTKLKKELGSREGINGHPGGGLRNHLLSGEKNHMPWGVG